MKSPKPQQRAVKLAAKIFLLCLACVASLFAQHAENATPPEYRAFLHALGQGHRSRIDSLLHAVFLQSEIPPDFFETAPLSFVYQNRASRGFAFFDSLNRRGKFQAEALGAMGALKHHARENRESLQYLRQALEQGCHALRPYDLFVTKSFELDSSEAALQFLTKLSAQNPDNWRYRFALAQWHYSAREPQAACEILRGLLVAGHVHWRLYSALGSSLTYLGKHEEALAQYETGQGFCARRLDEEGELRMLHGLADTEYTLGQITAAKDAHRQAAQLAERIGNEIFSCRLHLLASRILINEQKWLAASDTLRLTERQAIRFSEGITLLRAYYQLMDLNRTIGKWEEAVKNTLKTATVADSLGLKAFSLDMLSIIGVIDLEAGRNEEALLRHRQLEEIAKQRGILLHRIPFLLSLTKAFAALERYKEAQPCIDEGLRLAKESGNAGQILDFQMNQSAVWLHTGKLEPARGLLRETIAVASQKGQTQEWLGANLLLADVHLREGQTAAARALLRVMLDEFAATPPYNTYLKIIARLAETHMREKEVARAIELYTATRALIATQSHILNPSGLSGLSQEERTIYFGLSQAYLRTNQTAQALAVTEEANDVIVRRKKLQARLLRKGELDEKLQQQLARLDSLVLALKLTQAATASSGEALVLEGKVREQQQQRATLLAQLLPRTPMEDSTRETFALEKFQRMLKEREELAVKFFVGPAQTLVFFLDGKDLHAKEIPAGHARLQGLLTRIHQLLTPRLRDADSSYHAELDRAAAFEVYQLLLAEWLQGRNAKRLALVPDGVLHALPFDLLVTTREKASTEFLARQYAIRNGVSFSSLLQEPEPEWQVESVLMLANPTLKPEQAQLASMQRRNNLFLPVGQKELEAVQKLVRIHELLTGDEGNKARLFPALQKCDWFHFASHSVSRSSEPLYAEFILAMLAGQSEPERAYAFEIFQMQLRTKLAILSACETARGAFFNGEGFEGFVQAFRAAGTPSVIASLWKVENNASAQFFEHYYSALRERQSTSTAMQTAKLKMLADARYGVLDWAAFNYYGQDWKVTLPQARTAKSSLLIILAAAVLAGMIGIYYANRRKRA